MIVVNFGHPITTEQQEQIAALAGGPVERIIDVPTHFDNEAPFAPQVADLVAGAGLTPVEWQTLPLLVNLPSFAPVVAVLLAYLHGLTGHFLVTVRMAPRSDSTSTAFAVEEIIRLQDVRDSAREHRS